MPHKKPLPYILGVATIAAASIILVASGFGIGYYYHALNNPDRIEALQKSQVIQTVNAFAAGTLGTIEGRILTIENGKDVMAIPIREQANIARIFPPKDTQQSTLPEREPMDFQDLKIGDRINIFIEVSAGGSLEGIGVDVL